MRTLLLPFICLILVGCAGLDSERNFKCKAPEGIGCSSLYGTYMNAVQNNLPGQPAKETTDNKNEKEKDEKEKEQRIVGIAPSTGMPVLSEPVVLRIWMAPWEDNRGVLHDQSYMYVIADTGHWQIEHNRKRIVEKYRLLSPPSQKKKQPGGETQNQTFQIPKNGTTNSQ